MDETKEIHALLAEIRDINDEHLAEYRKQAARSIALAEEAVARQRSGIRLYKGALVACAIVVLLAFAYLARSMFVQGGGAG